MYPRTEKEHDGQTVVFFFFPNPNTEASPAPEVYQRSARGFSVFLSRVPGLCRNFNVTMGRFVRGKFPMSRTVHGGRDVRATQCGP